MAHMGPGMPPMGRFDRPIQASRSPWSAPSAAAPPSRAYDPFHHQMPSSFDQNTVASTAERVPIGMDDRGVPRNAPRGPRHERPGRYRQGSQPENTQFAHFDHGRLDAMEEYMHRGVPEFEEWKRVRRNLRRTRMGRIDELDDEQKMVPQTYAEFLQHKAEIRAIYAQVKQPRIPLQQRVEAIWNERKATFGLNSNALSPDQPFISSVLGKQTIWTSVANDWSLDWSVLSPWPSREELKEEGDERHTSQYGRHLPCPRVATGNPMNWKQKLYKPASELDCVSAVPIRIYMPYVRRDGFGDMIDDPEEPGRVAFVQKNPFGITALTQREVVAIAKEAHRKAEVARINSERRQRFSQAIVPHASNLELSEIGQRMSGLGPFSFSRRSVAPQSSRSTASISERSLIIHPSGETSTASSATSASPQPHQGAAGNTPFPIAWSIGALPTSEQFKSDPVFRSFATLYDKPLSKASASTGEISPAPVSNNEVKNDRALVLYAAEPEQEQESDTSINIPEPHATARTTVETEIEGSDNKSDDTGSDTTIKA